MLNRRRGRVLSNRHCRTDGKLPGSSQNPFTESDFDENLEHSGSDSGQHGISHIVDHWHSADSPSFSEWDLGMSIYYLQIPPHLVILICNVIIKFINLRAR